MSKEEGFKNKYLVARRDGRDIGRCVVLEFQDKLGRIGIKAWSKAMRLEGYTKCADEVDTMLQNYESGKEFDE